MKIFDIISGLASIASLIISVYALVAVHKVKVKVGLTKKSRTKITQKAVGKDIRQSGRDLDG